MRVLPLEPRGGDASGAGVSPRWDEGAPDAVREAALTLLPIQLGDVAWEDHAELGPVAIGTGPDGAVVVAVVAELDSRGLVAGLARTAAELPLPAAAEAAGRAELVVLTAAVTPEVTAALALIGAGTARILLVDPNADDGDTAKSAGGDAAAAHADLAGDDAAQENHLAGGADPGPTPGTHITSARGRRRGRPAVPALAPREQLAAVAALVGEAELTLDGTEGEIRAVLGTDGAITVAGAAFDDPLQAALAQGREVSDGWAAWRFGVAGPYLGEALEEALNPGRAQRPARRRTVRR